MGYFLAKQKYERPTLAMNDNRHAEFQTALEKVMKLFEGDREVSNNDVERALGVSDATATNYLSALEKQGKITQLGDTGSGVKYRLK